MDTTTERLANVLRSLNALYTFHELFPYSAKQVTEALAEYDAALKQQPRHEDQAKARTAEVPGTGITVTDDMVTRFLGWRLPAGVHPDGTYPSSGDDWLSGTNLLTADQAKAMLEHVLTGAPRHEGAEDARDAAYFRQLCEMATPYKNSRHGEYTLHVEWDRYSLREHLAAIASERSGT